jgi:predicted chitinase
MAHGRVNPRALTADLDQNTEPEQGHGRRRHRQARNGNQVAAQALAQDDSGAEDFWSSGQGDVQLASAEGNGDNGLQTAPTEVAPEANVADTGKTESAGGKTDREKPAGGDGAPTTPSVEGATPTSGRYIVFVKKATLVDGATRKPNGSTLEYGTAVDALEELTVDKAKWVHIKAVEGGTEGWVRSRNIRQVSTQLDAAAIDEAALKKASDAAVAAAPADLATQAASTIPVILKQAAMLGEKNGNRVAYMLATAQHESRMGDVMVEKRNGFRYAKKTKKYTSTVHTNGEAVVADSEDELETKYWDSAYGGKLGNEAGTTDARNYRGRGYVQITGRESYKKMSAVLNAQGFSYSADGQTWGGQGNPKIDLVANYTHVNTVPELAARLLVEGSKQGHYTQKALSSYIKDDEEDPDFYNARSVINGDKAKIEPGQTESNGQRIADIAKTYAAAITPLWSAVFKAAGDAEKPKAE